MLCPWLAQSAARIGAFNDQKEPLAYYTQPGPSTGPSSRSYGPPQLTRLAVLLANDPDPEDSDKAEIASKIRKDEAFAPEVAKALEDLKTP